MVNNISSFGITGRTVSSKGKTENVQKYEQEQTSSAQTCSYKNVKAYQTGFNNTLKTADVCKKYNEIKAQLDPETRVMMNKLLQSGVLLNNDSNDGSSVLDNLHKIVSEPRIKGLDSSKLLKETINTIYNPASITQRFGDVPENVANAVSRHPELGILSKSELDIGNESGTCVVASVEFNLAQKHPAEFARMTAGLSSEDFCVTKHLPLSSIAATKEDAFYLLDNFKIPYQKTGEDAVNVKIQPDRNAIIRARVQTSYKDPGERSVVDVLMQSALINVGSQNTYNSLNDTRATGKFSNENKGLAPFEANFIENITSEEYKNTITYHELDENHKITGRICDLETIQNHLLNTLQNGENVIIGYVNINDNNEVISGHEMTVTNAFKTPNNEIIFSLNDTNNEGEEPFYISAEELLPRVAHATISDEALGGTDVPKIADWIEYFKRYADAQS